MPGTIVDSHQHFWQVGRFDYPWMTAELGRLYRDYLPPDLEPLLAPLGIEQTVLVQASNSVEETRWLLELSDRYQFIAGVVGWVDLASSKVSEQIAEFAAHPRFKGVRHLVESESDDAWLARPEVLNGLAALADHDISYDLLVHTRHLRHVLRVAERCPRLQMVIDHLAKPPIGAGRISEWSGLIKEIAAVPGIHCKLSGLVTEASHTAWTVTDLIPFVEVAIEAFGPERMMFGSDWPVCLLAASYGQVESAYRDTLKGLNPEARRRILATNAASFYRLEN